MVNPGLRCGVRFSKTLPPINNKPERGELCQKVNFTRKDDMFSASVHTHSDDKNIRKMESEKKNAVETARLQFFVDGLSAIIDIMRYPIRATNSVDLPRRATTEKGGMN